MRHTSVLVHLVAGNIFQVYVSRNISFDVIVSSLVNVRVAATATVAAVDDPGAKAAVVEKKGKARDKELVGSIPKVRKYFQSYHVFFSK